MDPRISVAIGWWLVAIGFSSGALMGLLAQRENWLGGYASRSRRLVRLGHISFVALGALNVIWPLTSTAQHSSPIVAAIRFCFVVGGVTMGPVCILTAWRWQLRVFFIVPASALIAGAILAAVESLS